jgi:hypothetical protein
LGKIYTLLRRTPGTGYYEFRDFVRGAYAKAALAAAGAAIERIVTYHVLEHDFRPTTNAGNHRWSAALAFWFDSEDAAMQVGTDPAFTGVPACFPAEIEESSHLVVREVPVSDTGGPAPTKIFAFFTNSLPKGNPMSREEMLVRWTEHAGRMKGANLNQIMTRFTQNQVIPEFHAANRRYDYDGVSEIWFESVEKAEMVFKSYEAEQAIIPSSARMGGTAGDCVYLRTDEVEVFRR